MLLSGTPLANGVTYETTIETLGDVDEFSFQASAGDHMFYQLTESVAGSSFTPHVSIIAPDSTVLYSTYYNASHQIQLLDLPQSGTYTIQVSEHNHDATGSFYHTLMTTHAAASVLVDEGELTSGETRTNTISRGDLDVFTFDATMGENVFYQLTENTGGSSFSPHVTIVGPNNEILYNTYYNESHQIQLLDLPATGTYTVIVAEHGGDGVGEYVHTFVQPEASQNLPGDEGTLVSGETRTNQIDPGDLDVFTFEAQAGDNVFYSLAEAVPGGSFTPYVTIVGPGDEVLYNTYYNASHRIQLLDLAATGTYTVILGDHGGDLTGEVVHTFVQTQANHDLPGDEGVLTSGQTRTNTLGLGDLDVFTFEATMGENAFYQLAENTGGSSFSPYVTVVGPNNEILYNTYYNESHQIQLLDLPATGTYTIIVAEHGGDSVGEYIHTFVQPKASQTLPGDEGALTSGVTRTNDLGVGDLDVFTFTGQSGDNVFFSLAEAEDAGSFTPYVTVVGPDNSILYNTYYNSSHQIQLLDLAVSGEYTIVVAENGGNTTGGYQHTFVQTPATHSLPDDEGRLLSGETRTNTMIPGGLDVFTFEATAGDTIRYQLSELEATNFTPWVTIVSPSKAVLYNTYYNTSHDIELTELTESGTYTIIVAENGSNAGGTYEHTLTRHSNISKSSIIGFVNGNWWISRPDENGNYTTEVAARGPASDFQKVVSGDFNGDGIQDVAAWLHNGEWRVGLGSADGQFTFSTWTSWTAPGIKEVHVGDFNNDGRDDIIGLFNNGDRGRWWVARSEGDGFVNRHWGNYGNYHGISDVLVGNFDGVKGDDLAVIANSGVVWMVKTSNSRFQYLDSHRWSLNSGVEFTQAGDFNGDGREDIVAVFGTGQDRSLFVAKSIGPANGFASVKFADLTVTQSFDSLLVGDFNNDGRDDVAARLNGSKWWVGEAGINTFDFDFWADWSFAAGELADVQVGDTNGDGISDILGRDANGRWFTGESTGSSFNNRLIETWAPVDWQFVQVGDLSAERPAQNPASPLTSASAANNFEPFGAEELLELLHRS
ncbi:FG-GAP repeat domain-containing protein [Rubinisphaera margarita]|uniref:FG-GAP repeat domain-containing protein n=1 Tax=Rubinisphaera margarita TaxID=2909586 RepID=UPI001EE975B3|nr:VCBS repeat-containing protein [Rubinisphaera margarita]MCG6157735.1 VCBS repeat-containing protein [Rubinisphaera margarita]